jgi:hypothetical protein
MYYKSKTMVVYILGLVWMHMYPPQSCHSNTHGSREINVQPNKPYVEFMD